MGKDVIIACDFASGARTLRFLEQFGSERPFVKIGMELFYSAGPTMVRALKTFRTPSAARCACCAIWAPT